MKWTRPKDRHKSSSPNSQQRSPKRQKIELPNISGFTFDHSLRSHSGHSCDDNHSLRISEGLAVGALKSMNSMTVQSETAGLKSQEFVLQDPELLRGRGTPSPQDGESSVTAPCVMPITNVWSPLVKQQISGPLAQDQVVNTASTQNLDSKSNGVRQETVQDFRETDSISATEAGHEGGGTGNIFPSQSVFSKDGQVTFPLCTSCGAKRVFSIGMNGETGVLW